MKLLWLTFLAIILIVVAENIQLLNYAIIRSMRMFKMSNPSIVYSSLTELPHKKRFSNYGQSNLHDFMVIFKELADYKWNEYPETQVAAFGKTYSTINS